MTVSFTPDRHGRVKSNGIFAAAKITRRSSPQRASSPGTPISDDKAVAKMGTRFWQNSQVWATRPAPYSHCVGRSAFIDSNDGLLP
jgi:hypothetical protein